MLWSSVVLLVAAVFAAVGYRQPTLPRLDGQTTVTGLRGPVDIVRDAAGIPHAYARVESVPMQTKREAVEQGAVGTWRLQP